MNDSEDGNPVSRKGPDFRVPEEISESKALSQEVRERLRHAVHEAGGNRAVAKRAGVALSTLNDALAGTRSPRATAIAAIAEAAGRSLDWIFFGRVEISPPVRGGFHEAGVPYEAPGEIGVFEIGDEVGGEEQEDELHGRIIDTIVRVAKQVGATIPPVELGRRAAGIHRELVAATSDHQERLAMLKLLTVQLRKELIAPSPAQSQAQSGGSG